MNILATQYTLTRKSLEIYLAGCNGNPHCSGCHNPETWNFNQGTQYNKKYFNNEIKAKIENFDDMINNIEIFGGEPNDQNLKDLRLMLEDLQTLHKKIWLFTRYSFDKIPNFELQLCDYIKCGAYIPKLKIKDNIQYGIKLATSNQKIYKKGLDY